MTRGKLNSLLRGQVEIAHQKRLLNKIFETGPRFFGSGGHDLRLKAGVETKEHEPWYQGSDYTYWDYEVIFPFPMSDSGATRLSIRSHDLSRLCIDEWVRVAILVGDKVEVVLYAIRSDASQEEDRRNPQVAGGWRYETYLPGEWEEWLDIERIKKFLAERDGRLATDRSLQKQREESQKLDESPSVKEIETARRFGLV